MSPLPSPTPVRSAILRMVFSPTGLLLGFVVLLIVTCPGARGEESLGLLVTNDGLRSSAVDLSNFDVPVPPSRPTPVIGRSSRYDRVPVSSARSATPLERGLRDREPRAVDAESFRHSRAALPLLVDPLTGDAARAPSAKLNPMTGPAVGIRPQTPVAGR